MGHLTRLFADAGVVALASLVSPLKSDREIARALNDAAKLPFLEVYVATSLAECEKRDPKGLYARARAGELKGLTGVDAPYEAPEHPDLVLDTAPGHRVDRVGPMQLSTVILPAERWVDAGRQWERAIRVDAQDAHLEAGLAQFVHRVFERAQD